MFKKLFYSFIAFSFFHTALASQDILKERNIFSVPEYIKNLSLEQMRIIGTPPELGDSNAQFQLGEVLNTYRKKEKRLEAQDWWLRAALNQHAGAIDRIIKSPKGCMINFTEKNEERAKQRFRREYHELFTKEKDPKALFDLGNQYKQEKEHSSRALILWKAAARLEYKPAIEKLYKLNIEAIEIGYQEKTPEKTSGKARISG